MMPPGAARRRCEKRAGALRAALSRTAGLPRRRIFARGAVDHDPAVRRLWGHQIRSSQILRGGSIVRKLRLVCAALKGAILISATLAGAASAQAQEFPSRPIRVFVGFGPGSGADITAR